MYHPERYMTVEVLAEVLAEYEWPAPYTLEDWLPDGIVMAFPKSNLFFVEGFEGDMTLKFLPEDTGMDQTLTIEHALLAIGPDPEHTGGPLTPNLINDRSPHASLDKVKNGIRDLCTIILTHFQDCILGDFSWVAAYQAYLASKG